MIDTSSNSHYRRNQLNQFLLEAGSLTTGEQNNAEVLRQLERFESLAMQLHAMEEQLKLRCDPEWLESVTRILIVEDDHDQRNMLAESLRMEGFFVATAADGDEAINYLHSMTTPDVILMDIAMPNCSGEDFGLLAQNAPFVHGPKIIAVTAKSPEEFDCDRFDDYCRKPVDVSVLLSKISSCCSGNVTSPT